MKRPHVERTQLRVRYVETDAQGVVHHSAYIPWLEIGRIEFCRSLGVDYARLEAQGFLLAVVSLAIEYHAPAYFDNVLRVETRLTAMRRSSMQFHYDIVREEQQERLSTAEVTLVCLNQEKRPVPIPPSAREKFLASLAES